VTRPDDLAAAALDRYIERVLGPMAGRAWITIGETSKWMGLGRSSGYEAARRGDLPVIRIGNRAVVPTPALVALLLGLPRRPEALAGILATTASGGVHLDTQPAGQGRANGEPLTT